MLLLPAYVVIIHIVPDLYVFCVKNTCPARRGRR